MSSQQFPPMNDPNAPFGAPQPTVQQPSAPFASSPTPSGRRTGLIVVGALVLIAGLVAGFVMVGASSSNYDESVQNMARAPIGCTTSFEFDEAGTFTIYVETAGSIGEVRGDCPGTDTDYRYDGDELPDVDLVLVDEDGDEVDLDRDSSKDYDAGGSVGRSISSVDIDNPGDYELTVTSDDEDFAISVGKDPKDSADSLKSAGGLALIVGVVLGALLMILGLRRRKVPPAPPTTFGAPPLQTFDPGFPPAAGWAPSPTPYPTVPQPTAPPAAWPPAAPPAPPMSPPTWPAPPSARPPSA